MRFPGLRKEENGFSQFEYAGLKQRKQTSQNWLTQNLFTKEFSLHNQGASLVNSDWFYEFG